MFKLYNKYILPKLLDRDMRPAEFNETRSEVAQQASGTVLEIGFGPGYNFPFYRGVQKLYALDPSAELFAYAKERIAAAPFPVEYLQHSAEAIPLEDGSIDTVVSTWSLCSIPDAAKALREVKRVLKPSGKFVFVEHGRSPHTLYAAAQTLFTHVTRYFTGNCHLDRQIDALVSDSGLVIQSLEKLPEEGRPLMYSYQGVAMKRDN